MTDHSDGIVLRDLNTDPDREACLRLQTQIWGDVAYELVPPRVLAITLEIGGVAAGAFGGDGALLGFVWGMTGIRRGGLAHWSHMLGVSRAARDRGLGRRLKLYQREQLIERGVQTMYWTYDPLEARNAHLNFNRLGVTLDEYKQNYYGDDTASPRFAGLGTDRFVVRWNLVGERALAALDGSQSVRLAHYEGEPFLLRDTGEAEPRIDLAALEGERVRVEIPAAIQPIRRAGGELPKRWRSATREAFTRALDAGFEVDTFGRDPGSGRCYYGLAR